LEQIKKEQNMNPDTFYKLQSQRMNAGRVMNTSEVHDGEALQYLERKGFIYGGFVFCDDDQTVFYRIVNRKVRLDDDQVHNGLYPVPVVVIVDGTKRYYPDENGNSDASALDEYEGVVEAAVRGEKSQSTCKAVLLVADQCVLRLQNLNYLLPVEPMEETLPTLFEVRGMIERGKFRAVKIWREGKAKGN
jgi:hypothetical protein